MLLHIPRLHMYVETINIEKVENQYFGVNYLYKREKYVFLAFHWLEFNMFET